MRRHEALLQAKAAFRAGQYERVREIVSQPSLGTLTELSALTHIDVCAAILLNEPVGPDSPPYDDSEVAADDAVYYRALALWLRGHHRESERVSCAYRPHSSNSLAAFTLLRAWIFGARLQTPQQFALTMQVVRSLLDHAETDSYLLANASMALASLAREMPSDVARALLERALPRIAPSEHGAALVQVRRALAQVDALHGRFTSALRHLAFARASADDAVERAFVHFDYATTATWGRKLAAAKASFDVACDSIKDVDFECRKDEGAFVLSVGAIAGAPIDSAMAQRLAARAAKAIPTISSRWGCVHGPRAATLANEAIALTSSDPKIAIDLGGQTLKDFEALGHPWRAGRLAMHLFALTGQSTYRLRAQRLLEAYGDGPLAVNERDAS